METILCQWAAEKNRAIAKIEKWLAAGNMEKAEKWINYLRWLKAEYASVKTMTRAQYAQYLYRLNNPTQQPTQLSLF